MNIHITAGWLKLSGRFTLTLGDPDRLKSMRLVYYVGERGMIYWKGSRSGEELSTQGRTWYRVIGSQILAGFFSVIEACYVQAIRVIIGTRYISGIWLAIDLYPHVRGLTQVRPIIRFDRSDMAWSIKS